MGVQVLIPSRDCGWFASSADLSPPAHTADEIPGPAPTILLRKEPRGRKTRRERRSTRASRPRTRPTLRRRSAPAALTRNVVNVASPPPRSDILRFATDTWPSNSKATTFLLAHTSSSGELAAGQGPCLLPRTRRLRRGCPPDAAGWVCRKTTGGPSACSQLPGVRMSET